MRGSRRTDVSRTVAVTKGATYKLSEIRNQ